MTRPYSLTDANDTSRFKSSEYLADALQILVHTQQDLIDAEKFTLSDDSRVRSTFLAMHSKVTGLLQELRWKPWALKDSRGRRRRVNRESALRESVGVFLHLAAILTILQEDYEIAPRDIMYALAHEAPQAAERLRKQRV